MIVLDLINVLFPKVCFCCDNSLSDNERCICTSCRIALPVTNFHYDDNRLINKMLYGRVPLVDATALFYFSKSGLVQHLIHNLKYKGYQEIGVELGRWLGFELKESNLFKNVDVVIPVPLHRSKLRKRGFNQVEKFAQEIAKSLEVPFLDNVLLRVKKSHAQAKKGRLLRILEMGTKFHVVKTEHLVGKHILLVDDVITTGTTIESCYIELKQITGIEISLATIAFVN